MKLKFGASLAVLALSGVFVWADENDDHSSQAIQQEDAILSDADAAKIASFYTSDGKIFPGNSDIVSGRPEIEKRWQFAEGASNLFHKVTPVEIRILNNYAYDYGYYEGSITNKDKKVTDFKGKYVIVWRKEIGDWKIYLDIWNRL